MLHPRTTTLTIILAGLVLLTSACAFSEVGTTADTRAREASRDTVTDEAVTAEGSDDLPAPAPFFWEPGADPDPPSSIDLSEIISGGPPPDGIPPIDDPTYVTIAQADEWIADNEPVMVVELDGAARAYPLQIMTYHEIVNDRLAGQPVLVTYCPLCNSGLAFDPTVQGQTLDFGTSGRLWRSNLVMYDRQTQSLWSQFTGEAVVGGLLGQTLERLPIGLVSWADYRQAHPDGDVLSRDTGYDREYGSNPYSGYDDSSSPFLYRGPTDDSLPQLARVLAFGGEQDPAVIPLEVLQRRRVVATQIDGRPAVALWTPGVSSALDTRQIADGQDVGATGLFDPEVDGEILQFSAAEDSQTFTDDQTGSTWDILGRAIAGELQGRRLTRLTSDDTFWFVQFAFRPETRIEG
ncbi:MAG: DUF3179 domain-containing protein [Euzebya sp.]